ncbi:MAG: hypothetical protein AB7O28_17995 [Vicinamibacterales bacterium]
MEHDTDAGRWIERYAGVALGAAFLSAVASRFGLWDGRPWQTAFAAFVGYTGEVNAFMPAAVIPWLAWSATLAETAFGTLLIAGLLTEWAAAGSAVLLALFGTAMAASQGPKSPLDYSVFSASAAALLLADRLWRRRRSAARN